MPKDKDENGDGGKTENMAPDTNLLIAQALQQLVANQPKHVITEGSPEFQEFLRSQGFFDTFPKPVYQNGRECEPKGLSHVVRERASSLRPGTYLSGKVTVEGLPNGGGVHIKYKSKTVEDRMSQTWRTFPELIDKVWAEMHQTLTAA
jgi:hypothetical protein